MPSGPAPAAKRQRRMRGNSYGRFAADYVRKLNGEQTDIVTREQALISVKIVEGIQKSAASGVETRIG